MKVKEATVTVSKNFLEKGEKIPVEITTHTNLKGKNSDYLPVSLHLSVAAVESA